VGYIAGSVTLDDWQRIFNETLIPLYACGVLTYIVLRVYHVVIEPRIVGVPVPKSLPPALSIDSTSRALLAPQPIDMTGTFKLLENNNFEELLAAQGVPWALRSAANRARPTHKITHRGNILTIKIEGIIETETTYEIGGSPTDSSVRGRQFKDSVTYLEDKTGIQTMKRAINDGYSVRVCRRLAPDRSRLTMTSTLTFDDKSRETVECIQIFHRIESQ
jgi:hypothetical protein